MKYLRKWHADRVLMYGPVRAEEQPRVRFFMCGEYGSLKDREHWHACIFGMEFEDITPWKLNGENVLYRSQELEKLWTKGYSTVGRLTYESAAYVAKYCTKTKTGEYKANERDGMVDTLTGEIFEKTPEFGRMSLKPGIGATWIEKYLADVYTLDKVVKPGGVQLKPPKYYDKYLKKIDILRLEKLKQARFAKATETKEDSTPERLKDRETVLRAKFNLKKRSL